MYLGISPSTFDELRRDDRIGPGRTRPIMPRLTRFSRRAFCFRCAMTGTPIRLSAAPLRTTSSGCNVSSAAALQRRGPGEIGF